MIHIKSLKKLYVFLVIAVLSFGITSCRDVVSDPTGPSSGDMLEKSSLSKSSYPAELFPDLVMEEWFFFNPEDKSFHHYELFTYQYDSTGQRIRGDFYHSETGNVLVLTYNYNSKGKPIGEHWENPYYPIVYWDITYKYSKDRIVGGHGTGFYIWDFSLTFDSKGRRATTTFSSDDPIAPRFTLTHQYDDQGRCLMATGIDQNGRDMLVVYTYAD